MSTFFNRLMQISDYNGFKSLNDFALKGLKYDSSSKLNRLKDKNKKSSIDILEDITNKFQDIDLHWLLRGKGKMLKNSEDITTDIIRLEELIHDLKERLKDKEDVIEAQKITIESLKSEILLLREKALK